MFMIDIKDYSWWYWVVTSICLWLTMTVYPEAYQWTVVIAVIQLLHFSLLEGSATHFSVQIRWGFLIYLLIALPENLQWILWLPAFGTLARVLFGYCLMARLLMLLPFNRKVKLTWQFVREAFLTPPVRGSILHGLPSVQKPDEVSYILENKT